ncbi:hypothetical protein SAMN02927924_01860 [Sphingobium faniae]|nr:hypothetical protein SAMN02927924_01860 [Sphingobium faniae]
MKAGPKRHMLADIGPFEIDRLKGTLPIIADRESGKFDSYPDLFSSETPEQFYIGGKMRSLYKLYLTFHNVNMNGQECIE